MGRPFYPLFVVPCIVQGKKTIFHKADEKVVVSAPGDLIRKLTNLCDGRRTLDSIEAALAEKWDKRCIRRFVAELRRNEVLVDSHTLSKAIWPAVENPSRFSSLISDDKVRKLVKKAELRHKANPSRKVHEANSFAIGRLLERRKSVRIFSQEAVGLQDIVKMLWAAYGEVNSQRENDSSAIRRTTPSAGALYPLMISLIIFRKSGHLDPAIYHVWLGKARAVGFKKISKDILRFVRSFANPLMLDDGPHGVIVISGSFQVTGEKYGNRSLL